MCKDRLLICGQKIDIHRRFSPLNIHNAKERERELIPCVFVSLSLIRSLFDFFQEIIHRNSSSSLLS